MYVFTIGLKRLVQKVVIPAKAKVEFIINMDNIWLCEVSTPAKSWMFSNFGNEAFDPWGVLLGVFEASTSA